MKISEAMAKLGAIKREHGDLRLVTAGNSDEFEPGIPSFCESHGAAMVIVDIGGYCHECSRGCD